MKLNHKPTFNRISFSSITRFIQIPSRIPQCGSLHFLHIGKRTLKEYSPGATFSVKQDYVIKCKRTVKRNEKRDTVLMAMRNNLSNGKGIRILFPSN